MAKQKQPATAADRWRQLTWDDLEGWAGSRSVQRGRSYQRSGHVRQLAQTEDGSLLAWVQGTERYAARVNLPESGKDMESRCTCPVGFRCKHAVAVVLDYLDALKEGREVPTADESDRRLRLLEVGGEEEESDEEEFDEEEEYREEEHDEEPAPAARRGRRSRGGKASSSRGGGKADVRSYLESLSQTHLIDYVLELARRFPEIDRELKARGTLARGEAGELVKAARREIRELTSEPAWYNHWSGEGSLPDYNGLKQLFERLLELGQADALLDLGETLLEAGTNQIEQSHDEGETGSQIAQCMEVVFRAVPASSRPDADKLLYAINLCQRDEYELCRGVDTVLDREWPAEAWSAVADALAARLQGERRSGEDKFFRSYRRDGLTNWLAEALEKAGRKAEVLLLFEAEAPVTNSYVRLVDALLAARRPEDARRWALEGIERTKQKLPGIAEQLRERLRGLVEKRKDWPTLAAVRAEEFFAGPGLHTLEELEKAAAKAGCAAEVRAAALNFLETGTRPAPAQAPASAVSPSRRPAKRSAATTAPAGPPWPLPAVPPELKPVRGFPQYGPKGPHYDVLLDLAFQEKRPDDILRWFDKLHETRRAASYGYYYNGGLDGRVADAVAGTHPDRAEKLYKDVIGSLVARTSPAAYEAALPYLRKLKKLLHGQKRVEEWDRYLAHLRETERRKRRFMEVLDRIERRPIVEG
ncbi:MAG TPA: SWIM zinc finger family protein [Gemmataceae bacterium]|nr:SWIM zinc finger family protein [Gemmataceae bacterium]